MPGSMRAMWVANLLRSSNPTQKYMGSVGGHVQAEQFYNRAGWHRMSCAAGDQGPSRCCRDRVCTAHSCPGGESLRHPCDISIVYGRGQGFSREAHVTILAMMHVCSKACMLGGRGVFT